MNNKSFDEECIIIHTILSEKFYSMLYECKDACGLSQSMTEKIAKKWLKMELWQFLSAEESEKLEKFALYED